ncbi:MAG: FHA domain-containing protein [Prevotellaceae bacterium]|jgi:hypothetical protein|nr:FHA domain-containing protein [Prevotellaceae bacterium]
MTTDCYGKLHVGNKSQGRIATFLLKIGENTIGRAAPEHQSQIEIQNDEYLSRVHFTIEVSSDAFGRIHYTLFDNHSHNGTSFYCKKTKTKKQLQPLERINIVKGDQIKAGDTYFEIEPLHLQVESKNIGVTKIDVWV